MFSTNKIKNILSVGTSKVKEIIEKELDDDDDKLSKKVLDFFKNESDKRDKDRNHILKLAKNMATKSDEELKRIYQTSSGEIKMAAEYLLKQRGY